MEIFELRYFFAVAQHENIHRAAEMLNVSPGSLSKAISRLEAELKSKVFVRAGRNIRLTEQGRFLKSRAAEILAMEESTRMEIAGHHGQLRVIMTGSEVLLSTKGVEITAQLRKTYPKTTFHYQACDDEDSLRKIDAGEAHLALITSNHSAELTARKIAETKFVTVVGPGHPLSHFANSKKAVPIDEVLKYEFVSPSVPLLGRVGPKQALDGWRDDEFPRKVVYQTTSLRLLESILMSGRALAYLPDYYAKQIGTFPIKVTGCPYSCIQKIKLVAKRPKDTGWLNRLF